MARRRFVLCKRSRVFALVLTACFAPSTLGCGHAGVGTADTALYVRSDTNDTVVFAPRAHVGGRLGENEGLGLDATYAMDSWTSSSIDITTAATGPVHEIRHEITASTNYQFDAANLYASYRYSTENDYWSHGGVIGTDIELAQKNTTLSLAILGSDDIVGRAEEPDYRKPQNSLGGRVSLTQVLDRKTLLQLATDLTWITGFQASPYRFVAVGMAGLCAGEANGCIEEVHPSKRLRGAASANLRRALADRLSGNLGYRYYFDDWGIQSHTISPEFSLLAGEHATLTLSYRFYMQSRADFYEPQYTQPAWTYRYNYFSRDRKMSALMNHHVGLQYLQEIPMESERVVWDLGLRTGLTRYHYQEFVGLEYVNAYEVTGNLGLAF